MAKWVCLTEKGWISYSDDDNRKIEGALRSDAQYIDLSFNGNSYRINFATMNQINQVTAVSRIVQRISSEGAEWLCDVNNNLVSYDDSDTLILENSFAKNNNGSVKVRLGKNEVNFRDMTQTNIQTGVRRKVTRRSNGPDAGIIGGAKVLDDGDGDDASDSASDGHASHTSDDTDSVPQLPSRLPNFSLQSVLRALHSAQPQLVDPIHPRHAAVWEVLTESGWIPLSSANVALLEPEYHSSSPAPVTIEARGTQYVADVAAMTQKNPSTNALRALRRLGDFEWECLADQGWLPYDDTTALAIERAHRARNEARCAGALAPGDHQTVAITRDGRPFEVDLEAMKQVNKATGFSRRVRRLGRAVWEFKDGAAWRAYGAADCLLLERRFADSDGAAAANGAAAAAVAIADGQYAVDVAKMRQTNTRSGFSREVRRIPAAPWGWWNNSRWALYDDADALALERAEREAPAAAPVTLRSGRYRVDVAARQQVNVASGFVRAVCRVGPPPPPPEPPRLSAPASALLQAMSAAVSGATPATPRATPATPRATPPTARATPPTARATTPALDEGIPPTWSASDPAKAELVEVARSTPEWAGVVAKFAATAGGSSVKRVQRVQNPQLWPLFAVARRAMAARGGAGANERHLFHGTDAATADKIVVAGFNRSFVSTHAYGMGTYFARDASYSVSYSKPDAAGDRRMFLVLVLVGEACVGSSSDKEPQQPRPGGSGPHDKCDTTVNSVKDPSIFVTYKDHQQYPDYLITFSN